MTVHNHAPATETARRVPVGRPQHSVTLGHHDAAIMQMREKGKTYLQIGLTLGCSDGTIISRLAVLFPVARANRRAGREPHAVTRGHYDDALQRMDAAGLNAAAMALRLNCSRGTVGKRLAMLRQATEAPHGRH